MGGIIRKALAGGAGTAKNVFLMQQQAQIDAERDRRQQEFQREQAEVVRNWQLTLEKVRAERGGTSSTLAELEYLNRISDPEKRKVEEARMMNLKRAGFVHGKERFDAAGNRIIDVDQTAFNESKVAGDVEKSKLESQLDIKPQIVQAEEVAKNAATAAKEAFDNINVARSQLRNIDEAIAALEAGAKTGAIQRYLPSFRESTIRLDNARQLLGLDNLANFKGSTTERELEISLDTAIPDKLDEPELRKWLTNKREQQLRTIDMLVDAAKFLETGTIGDWLTKNEEAFKNNQQSEKVNTPGSPSNASMEGRTATNPQTNETLIYRNGKWQPL